MVGGIASSPSVRRVVNKENGSQGPVGRQVCAGSSSSVLATAFASPVLLEGDAEKLLRDPSSRNHIKPDGFAAFHRCAGSRVANQSPTCQQHRRHQRQATLKLGRRITQPAMERIANPLRLTVGRSSRSASRTIRSLVPCRPRMASFGGPCSSSNVRLPSGWAFQAARGRTNIAGRRSARTVALCAGLSAVLAGSGPPGRTLAGSKTLHHLRMAQLLGAKDVVLRLQEREPRNDGWRSLLQPKQVRRGASSTRRIAFHQAASASGGV